MLSCYCKGGENMQIQPNSIIKLCSGVPIDSSYKDTIYFTSRSAQKSYFESKVSKTMDKASFQRINGQQGVVRMSANAESIYDCNYMMFQNTNYGSKWFYAFITNIVYVNDKVSNVYFNIDVMQTWFLFDCTLKECFVEREHSITDVIGDNLVHENVELGDYVSSSFEQFTSNKTTSGNTNIIAPLSIVVACTFNKNYTDVAGGYYSNLYSGLNFITFNNNATGAQECSEWLSNVPSAKYDGIVAIFLMPTNFITNVNGGNQSYTSTIQKLIINMFGTDGYQIKNNKLYTYPYNFLYLTNFQGSYADLHYEYFSDSVCNFTIVGDMTCNPEIVVIPNNYKGVVANYDEKMTLQGYPQLGWSTDSFKAWLAQSATSVVGNAMSTSMFDSAYANRTAIAGRYIPSAMGGVGAGVNISSTANPLALTQTGVHVANAIQNIAYHSALPQQAHGSNNGSILSTIGLMTIGVMKKHIREEYARIIDDYFTAYGYATHRVKVPNISVRPHWTYTKTIGSNVVSKTCSNNDVTLINTIFDNGITFWKNASEIGNYSLDNSPN